MANSSIIYQDAFVFLFLLLLMWGLCLFEKYIGSTGPDKSLINYLNRLFDRRKNASAQSAVYSAEQDSAEYQEWRENRIHIDKNINAVIKFLKRASFALLLLFCLPTNTVYLFKSNAQYYWALLACSIAIYQCIKFLIFEQLEQFENNQFVHKIIQSDKNMTTYEKQAVLIAIGWSLLWVIVIYFW